MILKLFLLFAFIPVLELYILVQLSGSFGIATTVALVFLTAAAGAYIVKQQGFSLMHRIQSNLQSGKIPQEELIEGLLLLCGGFTLLTPGFLTDIIGLTLVLSPSRRWIALLLKAYFYRQISEGRWQVRQSTTFR